MPKQPTGKQAEPEALPEAELIEPAVRSEALWNKDTDNPDHLAEVIRLMPRSQSQEIADNKSELIKTLAGLFAQNTGQSVEALIENPDEPTFADELLIMTAWRLLDEVDKALDTIGLDVWDLPDPARNDVWFGAYATATQLMSDPDRLMNLMLNDLDVAIVCSMCDEQSNAWCDECGVCAGCHSCGGSDFLTEAEIRQSIVENANCESLSDFDDDLTEQAWETNAKFRDYLNEQ